ncbi:MAG: hypothetical protein CMF52_07220 [Legionellales bacterium]|nr:hypothetical protein [Legionellales bacterium]
MFCLHYVDIENPHWYNVTQKNCVFFVYPCHPLAAYCPVDLLLLQPISADLSCDQKALYANCG